jgi:Reverse transcriptase (RNA-dependent DNA polymerase)/RNase H-like domain found in reverse transcriptase
VQRFGIQQERYDEFEYLCYLNIDDIFVQDYVNYHLHDIDPLFSGRLSSHLKFWSELSTPEWLQSFIETGVTVPFISLPPIIRKRNNRSVLQPDNADWVKGTIAEYLRFDFIEMVSEPPHCVLPLQVKETTSKKSLIFDMTAVNDYVQTAKFKLEGWETMFLYAMDADFGIKFDLKKFYHEIPLNPAFRKYFGFAYDIYGNGKLQYYVWKTLPYGYSRAPYIARQLIKPLIAKWRTIGANCVVFYDDGMCVAKDPVLLRRISLQMHCDIIRAGLVPGNKKCIWTPVKIIDWNGLRFDFHRKGIAVLPMRILKIHDNLNELLHNWPNVTFRDVSRCVGRIISMSPVFQGESTIFTKMLQTFVNIRHYKNLPWDAIICADYPPLFDDAKFELNYWQIRIETSNFRAFVQKLPEFLAWTDASDMAVAGLILHKSQIAAGHTLTIDSRLTYLVDNITRWQSVLDSSRFLPVLIGHDAQKREAHIMQRQLWPHEMKFDSNERELIAILHLVKNVPKMMTNTVITLHTDSHNAAIIISNGSNKPRLNAYARKIFTLCSELNITLNVVWIPRDLNKTADFLSRIPDLDNYSITNSGFDKICNDLGDWPDVDLFADAENAKTANYFSLFYEKMALGVNAYNYSWDMFHLCWLFPPVKQIARAFNYLLQCKGRAIFIIPQWKFMPFYVLFTRPSVQKYIKCKFVYDGGAILKAGRDLTSYFGPQFNGNLEVYLMDCM